MAFGRALNPNVFLLKLTPGLGPELIPAIFQHYDCVIVESFGVGGIPQRLMDAFAESKDLPASYLQKALGKIEKEREALRQAQRRESGRIPLPEKLVFGELSFEEKKAVAAQFIRRIEVAEDSAEIIWAV